MLQVPNRGHEKKTITKPKLEELINQSQHTPFTTGNLKEIPKEFTSHKLTNLIDNVRSQLSIITDEKSIELEDRLEFMKR
ncbi:unnamed protein product [Trichobilharzia regenti]|nr:unnamed protein product [Trichobilharzia regenti]